MIEITICRASMAITTSTILMAAHATMSINFSITYSVGNRDLTLTRTATNLTKNSNATRATEIIIYFIFSPELEA